jgi:hypothetical protein
MILGSIHWSYKQGDHIGRNHPVGDFLSWAVFRKLQEQPNIFGTLFSTVKVMP